MGSDRTACSSCSARAAHTAVRDGGMGGVDATMGLDDLGGDQWACPACGKRYRCRVERPVPPIYRCPACRSLDVGRNESRSAYDLTFMECLACGYGALVDWVERDDWVITVQDQQDARLAPLRPSPVARSSPALAGPEPEPEPEPELGCVMCTGEDAEEAWESMETRHERSLVREVHFGIDLKRCFCDQLFVVVFTERVDYRDGDDDQTWLALPITEEERARLEASGEADLPKALVAVAGRRRFLARSRSAAAPWWCEGGFSILPHD